MARGSIFYDASCGICSASALRWQRLAARHGFEMVPLQSAQAEGVLGLTAGKIPDEVKLLAADGRVIGGIDAILHVARSIWWAWPAWLFGHLPGIHALMVAVYRRLARRRHAISRACRISP